MDINILIGRDAAKDLAKQIAVFAQGAEREVSFHWKDNDTCLDITVSLQCEREWRDATLDETAVEIT